MALSNVFDAENMRSRLQSWIQKHQPGAIVTDAKVPEKSGLSAITILFTAIWDGTEHPLVARIQPTGPALFMEYNFDLEFQVLRALSQCPDIPVPEALYLEASADALGAPFYVMRRIDGRVAADDPPFTMDGWVLELSATQRSQMSDAGLATLAALHGCDPHALGLKQLLVKSGNDSNTNLRLVAYWEQFYQWARNGEDNPLIEHGLKWLKDHAPDDDDRLCLSWGDARLGNMIIAGDLSVAAVLDWEMVTIAAPELDLAWWMFLMTHHSAGIGAALPEGFPDDAGTIAKYEAFSGRRVQNLDYYMVFAGVRMCILVLRAANLMIGAGLLPADAQMGRINPASKMTAGLLGLGTSDESAAYYFGNR
jgi:aminoglycoside phosphotransferase (APT) family kinase protein